MINKFYTGKKRIERKAFLMKNPKINIKKNLYSIENKFSMRHISHCEIWRIFEHKSEFFEKNEIIIFRKIHFYARKFAIFRI
jgi:hypothetical protein